MVRCFYELSFEKLNRSEKDKVQKILINFFAGDKHVEEIAKLAIVFTQSTRKIRLKTFKFTIQIRVGFHSGKY